MPLYDYKCKKCGNNFEKIVKSADELVVCKCGYIVQKKFPNSFNFRLEGSGWAKDGYSKGK